MKHGHDYLPKARRAGAASRLALAIALAAGCVAGATGFAAPAIAASKESPYSKEWQKEAGPVGAAKEKLDKGEDPAVVDLVAKIKAAKDADRPALVAQLDQALGGAISKLPELMQLATTPDDKFVTGQYYLGFGDKTASYELQRTGLKLMLDSGKAQPQQIPTFEFYIGVFSWSLDDYPMAEEYLTKAFDAGYRAKDLESMIFASFTSDNKGAEALERMKQMDAAYQAKGQLIPEDPLRRALQYARDEGLNDQTDDFVALLERRYPTVDNWALGVAVLLQQHDFESQEVVDLYRLLARTKALKTTRDYVEYVQSADARRMSNEVLPVLQDGIAKGLLKADDVFVKEAMDIATARAPTDRKEADGLASDAQSAKDGVAARAAGDNFLSLGDSAKAEEMYKLALQKGGVDVSRINTLLGIVQTDQGKWDDARASFQKVDGVRLPIAKIWLAYVDVKQAEASGGANAGSTAAADTTAN